MYKVLIIEDDAVIADETAQLLKNWNMDVRCAADFRNITAEFADYAPHVILLDISLPFMNGFYWCAQLRKVSRIPIVFISSASDNMNIVMAMNMGADDFISKPFDGNVLVAKIQAILRRTYDFADAAPVLVHRDAMLDTGSGQFRYGNQALSLSKNEFRILLELMKNKGRIVSREKLMEALWQTDEYVDDNALTVNIGRLRKKLESAGLTDFIETKFGQGYLIS